jgi:hypothetical protein
LEIADRNPGLRRGGLLWSLFTIAAVVALAACAPVAEQTGTPPTFLPAGTPVIPLPTGEPTPAGPIAVGEETVIREIQIYESTVDILESYPYQLRVHPKGYLSGCEKLDGVTQVRAGNTVTVSVTAAAPKDAMCITRVTDYAGDIALEGGFESGEYTIIVNGTELTLTL